MLLFLLLSLYPGGQVYAQPEATCGKSFKKEITNGASLEEFFHLVKLRNGRLLMVSADQKWPDDNFPRRAEVHLLDNMGNRIKSVVLPRPIHGMDFNIKGATDSTFFVLQAVHPDHLIIIKMNEQLEVIWSAKLKPYINYDATFFLLGNHDIHQDERGDIFIATRALDNHLLVFKLDGSGKQVWCKLYDPFRENQSIGFVSLTSHGNELYVQGDAPGSQSFMFRIEKSIGVLQQLQVFRSKVTDFRERLLAYKNGRVYGVSGYNGDLVFSMFDSTGKLLRFRRFVNAVFGQGAVMGEDGIYALAMDSSGSEKRELLVKMDLDLNLEYANLFDRTTDYEGIGMAIDDSGFIYAASAQQKSSPGVRSFLQRFDAFGSRTDCCHAEFAGRIEDLPTETYTFQVVEDSADFEMETFNAPVTYEFLRGWVLTPVTCVQSGPCPEVDIEGPDEVCLSGNEVAYNLNTQLTRGLRFETDSTIAQVSRIAQGVVYLKFKRQGSAVVKVVRQKGCLTTEDSIHVQVKPGSGLLDLGSDRMICYGGQAELDAGPGFLAYQWSNGLSTQQITVDRGGTYSVRALDACNNWQEDTITVSYTDTQADRPNPVYTICRGDSVTLEAPEAGALYTWEASPYLQHGDARNVVVAPDESAQFVVRTQNGAGCSWIDTVQVQVQQARQVSIAGKDVICQGENAKLEAGSFSTYLWQDGSSASFILAADTGSYWVRVTDEQGCISADTFRVIRKLAPILDLLPADTVVCRLGELQLQVPGIYEAYTWTGGGQTRSHLVRKGGQYSISVTDSNGCTGSDTVMVHERDCMTGFYMPTAFTPNQDGKNDLICPRIFGNVTRYVFTIYNRWGEVVFSSDRLEQGWNGLLAGRLQETGTFVWTCRYMLQGEPERLEKGHLLLIR